MQSVEVPIFPGVMNGVDVPEANEKSDKSRLSAQKVNVAKPTAE